MRLADLIAPEHLQLVGEAAEAEAGTVRSAGALFVGRDAATAFGDYIAGSNHVLPTGGAARHASALSVATFRRRMARVTFSEGTAEALAPAGAAIARAEGFSSTRSRWSAAADDHYARAAGRRGARDARLAGGQGRARPGVALSGVRRVAWTAACAARPPSPAQPPRPRWIFALDLDGSGSGETRTGVGFFDHMLDALARHGGLDLDVNARGDLETGAHHTVEDVGLLLGRALDEALGDRAGIVRFGDAAVPMDEARAGAAIDLSGRPLCVFEAGPLP